MYVIETRIKTRSNKTIWMPYKQYRTRRCVTLTKHQNNAALGVNILPDAIGQRNQHELHWRFS